ncbi:MAG: hypothetical protein M1831_002309 [Alyxoria varia]|nr:MAG: hypothetical protein M1831_002309 [Alyxoria varia]
MVGLSDLSPFFGSPNPQTEITDIRIYPIKSCRGISLRSTALTKQGLDFDRNWMIVDPDTKNFQTIRETSELTLLDTALENTHADGSLALTVRFRPSPGESVSVPARPTEEWLTENTQGLQDVTIWGNQTDAWIYNDDVNSLLSKWIGKPLALAYKGPTPRVLRGNGSPESIGREERMNFPDMMPIQIANEASIEELNSRLTAKSEKEITIERFRPNIIVKGGDQDGIPAWSEDEWKKVQIIASERNSSWSSVPWSSGQSTIPMDVLCRCLRCQVPNVDPETAEKHPKEPWDTLVKYRRIDEGLKFKPCFGMLCLPLIEGVIEVGTKFEIMETTKDHKFMKNH